MTATIDRRMADRRNTVREAGARRRLRRLLWLLVLSFVLGVGAWVVYQSPYLRVTEIVVDGAVRADVPRAVEAAGVAAGMPTINVRAATLEAALGDDPWVETAQVEVTWPGTVSIGIVEYEPAAWVEAGKGWMLASGAGTILEIAETRDDSYPVIAVGSARAAPGGAVDEAVAAAIAFVSALPSEISTDVRVAGTVERLTALVAGYRVELGYGAGMEDKARALAAVIREAPPAGASISVVSARRPAVNPRPLVETPGKVLGGDEESG